MLNSQTDEIKAKLDIVNLVSEYIQVKQAGANWRANCPFHNEKTPSFMVSRDKQIWHCFGCGEGGDVFSFIQKIEGLEFPEALRLLAEKAGVKLKRGDPALNSQKSKLLDINKLAASFFHLALLKSKEAQIARDYLQKRKLSDQTIDEFKIGYAPDSWDKLLNLFRKKNYKDQDIFDSGLVVKNDRSQFYDRFRQRLMFPIFDHNRNVVGFTGRILDESKANQGGKYVNSPQTLIYNKSLIIFGLDKAKQEIKKKNLAVIVEGQMDVISSHQAGITNVVASSGTALTLEQLKILQRYTNNLALAFDADIAGQMAAQRGIDTAISLNFNLKVIQLPEKINDVAIKDPDDCLKQGKKYWQEAIDQAVSIMDFYFNRIFKQFDKTNPQDKKEIASKLLKQISKLNDKVEQDHWLGQLADKLDVPESILKDGLNVYLNDKTSSNQIIKFDAPDAKDRDYLLAEQLLALATKYPENLEYIINHLDLEVIPDKTHNDIYKEIILGYNSNKKFDYLAIEKNLQAKNPILCTQLATLMLLADKDFFNYTGEQINLEIIDLIKQLKKSFLTKKLKQIQTLLGQAEKANDTKQLEALSKDFANLTDQLNNL